jgi:Holliday junction resolvase-like predicted endonuclease
MLEATATIAKHGESSVQGYITASHGSWLYSYVESRLGEDLICEYLIQPSKDLVLIPLEGDSLADILEETETRARQKVRKCLIQKRYGPPPDAKEIGLYFEILEFELLRSQFPGPSYYILHRYPAIDSDIAFLRENDISCDIDVTTKKGNVVRCVEVKSVSGAPGSPFSLTPREWDSRVWCAKHEIPYDIVVYYHARCQTIERLVVPATARLKHEPSGYWCFPG